MGGLLKYVMAEPSTDAVSGRVEAGTESVYNGAQLGYTFRGSANVPLSDTVAMRVSGFMRQDPGYIDNSSLGRTGVNEDHARGGHLALLWRASDTLSFRFNALYQDVTSGGTSDVVLMPGIGDLQQNYIQGVGQSDRRSGAYSLVIAEKIGSIDLTSISGYSVNSYHDSNDFGTPFTSYFQGRYGVAGTQNLDNGANRKVTQEIRLTAPLGQKLDGLLGVFYTHEDTPASETLLASNPTTGAVAANFLYTTYPTTYQEYAVFANLTYHFSDRFDVQLGGRQSDIKQTFNGAYWGPFTALLGQASPYILPEERANSNPFTFLVTPRFKVSDDLMLYTRVASGFRPGGPNQVVPGVPLQYQPDKTKNYEIGAKGDLLDHRLSFDASVYYIDWKNIQLPLIAPATQQAYEGNAGAAKSQGVELSVESNPISGLRIAAWVVFSEAELTESFPPSAVLAGTYATAGSPLPWSSRFSGNLSVDEQFPLVNDLTGWVGATVSYVGSRNDIFTSCTTTLPSGACPMPPPRQELPAYAKTDLRAGLKWDDWRFNLYANNVTDRRGLISGGYPSSLSDFFIIQPRTVGLSVSKIF